MKHTKQVIGLAAACFLTALWPTAAWAANAEAGKAVYNAKCKACHGTDGQGNPAMAKMMKVEMKPLSETSADVKQVVTEGTGKMKPVGGLAGADLDNVVAYVHSLKK
ncbi:MAG TPA: cytochrome c [Bryobacteraceae bacterium]|nr:cytochrome c [Bryobacteraceae bacterium]